VGSVSNGASHSARGTLHYRLLTATIVNAGLAALMLLGAKPDQVRGVRVRDAREGARRQSRSRKASPSLVRVEGTRAKSFIGGFLLFAGET
jgi:hypothetical protein